jgi:hypothetical protein
LLFHIGFLADIYRAADTHFLGGGIALKKHRFFAWAGIICFLLAMYTGYEKQ